MKIKVKDLHANPFRNLKGYPISKEKVNKLKASINETGFWDNMVIRKHEGEYQIAYGHHRLKALMLLDPDMVVDLPVKDLSDVMMLKMMANENMSDYDNSTACNMETVKAVRDFLNESIRNAVSLKDLKFPDFRKTFGGPLTEERFNYLKKNGVGVQQVQSFLGAPWEIWVVSDAWGQLNSGVSEEAIKMFDVPFQANEFNKAVQEAEQVIGAWKYGRNTEQAKGYRLSDEKVIKLAEKIKDSDEITGYSIRGVLMDEAVKHRGFASTPKFAKEKRRMDIHDLVSKFCITQMQAIGIGDNILEIGPKDIDKRDQALLMNAMTKTQKMINKFLTYNKK